MNRNEIITGIQNDINKFIENYTIYEEERELFERIFDVFEELKKPQSLAEFLGWEEDVEYATDFIFDGYKCKVINNILYFTRTGFDWIRYGALDFSEIKQAKKLNRRNQLIINEKLKQIIEDLQK